MDFEQLKQGMKEIVEITNSVPEAFKEKCFEMLLTHLLSESSPVAKIKIEDAIPTVVTQSPIASVNNGQIPLNAQPTIFMRRRGITKEQLELILHYELKGDGKGEVHFLREPNPLVTSVATAQTHWAFLLGLKGYLEGSGDFLVDYEELRELCRDKGALDASNFAANLKKTEKYFKSALTAKSTPQPLSDEGQTALAELIKTLVSQAK